MKKFDLKKKCPLEWSEMSGTGLTACGRCGQSSSLLTATDADGDGDGVGDGDGRGDGVAFHHDVDSSGSLDGV